MTDDNCGCPCFPCRTDDRHDCGLAACGYTKYRAMTKPIEHPKPVEAPELLRAQFKSIADPAAKARLAAYFAYCQETAGLEVEVREAKRREKHAEIFGGI